MRSTKSRSLALVLGCSASVAAVILPLGVMAGCGGGGDSGDSPPTTATEAGAGDGRDGAPSAEAGDGGTVVAVDFASARYPALTRKIGLNANLNTLDPAVLAAIDVASAADAPVVSGLLETKYGPLDFPGDPTSAFFPDSLFYRDGQGKLQTRSSPSVTTLRQRAGADGMVSFLQLAGMPCSKSAAICEDPATPDLFTVDGTATRPTNGNWYPLPIASQVAEMAQGLADFAANVAADGVPSMWALWQEPDHTLSRALSNEDSVLAYLGLYKAFATAVRQGDPDAVITGPAQNQGTGTNDDHSIDGAGFNAFVKNRGNGVGQGPAVPLDYVTIQNYRGIVSTLETIQNTRVAYADERFNRAPVMFNEWDIDKTADIGFTTNYDTPQALMNVLDQVEIMMNQPDLSYGVRNGSLVASVDGKGDQRRALELRVAARRRQRRARRARRLPEEREQPRSRGLP